MSGTNNIFTLWKHYDGSNFYNTHAHGSTGHRWYINGQEKLRVHSDGNIGIGSESPGRPLTITHSDPRIRLQDSDSGGHSEIYTDNSNIYHALRKGRSSSFKLNKLCQFVLVAEIVRSCKIHVRWCGTHSMPADRHTRD